MDKVKLKQILIEHNQKKPIKDYTSRILQKKIDQFKKTPFIIIISGIRRCGKSTILSQLRQNINSYYINFDDDRLIDFKLQDFQTMYELLIELFGEKDTFIFDEIQNIPAWERFIRRLHDENKKVYITGSNATMLSKELGTHLTGRHISLNLYPFSFKEFCSFKKQETSIKNITSKQRAKFKRLFNEYFNLGGFPEYLQTKKQEYLQTLYQNILYRDILKRYNIPQETPLKLTTTYTASNVSKELSFNQIRKLANLTSATTIKEYFSYLENSFLCFLISRYDSSLKKQTYYAKKAYFIDPAMIKILGFRSSNDYGRILENIVFLELKRQNKEIYFHKQKNECDFLIKKGLKITKAIQVTKLLNDNNKKRELNGLLEAMKQHKLKTGLILTENESDQLSIENKKITIMPIWEWLLSKRTKGD